MISQFLRKGAEVVDHQTIGEMFDGLGGACALGAIYVGVYGMPKTKAERQGSWAHLAEHMPILDQDHPSLGTAITLANDVTGMSFEEIAMWLEEKGL